MYTFGEGGGPPTRILCKTSFVQNPNSAHQVPRAVVVRAEVDLTEEEVSHFLIKPCGPVCPQVTKHVEERASRHKHLAGGVVFVDAIPRSTFPHHFTPQSSSPSHPPIFLTISTSTLSRYLTLQSSTSSHPALFLAILPSNVPRHLTLQSSSPSHPPLFLSSSPSNLPRHLTLQSSSPSHPLLLLAISPSNLPRHLTLQST